jgi:WD40 repeat protein
MRKLSFVLLLLSSFACAQGTRTWQQSTFDDFEKGTAKGVAVRSDGALELAPSFTQLFISPSTYLWSIASDAQGNVYLAAGSPARVYKIAPGGQSQVVFEPKELQVQALTVDKSGVIYAATSPDGKVYRIVPPEGAAAPAPEKRGKGKKPAPAPAPPPPAPGTATSGGYTSSVFFDPQTKYIWDVVLDEQNNLYVATGDRGEIFKVTPAGEGALFFKSDEAHIRVLAVDPKGDLVAGSDGSGLVYRISPAGEAFVLYSAPKKEITALALDKQGNIYAAGTGEKRTGAVSTAPGPAPAPAGTLTFSTTATANPQAPAQPGAAPAPAPSPIPIFRPATGSEVYEIAPDGSPKRLWSSADDLVYALDFDSHGRLLAGSGNKGRIYVIAPNGDYVDLMKASATQVTGFAHAPDGGLYVATSNLGKVFMLGPGQEKEGTYESDVFDARDFSHWGRFEYRGSGNVELEARSGNVDNPDRNWSSWKKVSLAGDVAPDIPPARFMQWRAVMHPGPQPAVVDSVLVNYRMKNVAPSVDDVAVQPGARFQELPRSTAGAEAVSVGAAAAAAAPAPRAEFAPAAYRDPEWIAIRWSAHDDNDDDLVYSIYYRGDHESNWKLLKDGVTEKYYSAESALFPDGGYVIKVVASDAPAHSPDDALSDEKESARFEIDTTPPVISDVNATNESGALHVIFRAVDAFSPVSRAEYSIDAGSWKFVEPVGQISDARSENYDFTVALPPVADDAAAKKAKRDVNEHTVVVRAYDRYNNMATAKAVVRGK